MARIKGILFDKDGTLFDFQATWAAWCGALLADLAAGDGARFVALAKAVGYDADAARLRPGSVVVADTPPVIARALAPHLPEWSAARLVDHMNRAAAAAPQVEILPLAPFLCRLRRRGLRLGVVTNDAEALARAHLRRAGVLGDLDFIAGSDSGHAPKPAPDALLAFCRGQGLRPGAVAMIGDSLHDLLAGRSAGMTCIAVDSGMTSLADLVAAADVTLPDIGALEGWLDSRGAG